MRGCVRNPNSFQTPVLRFQIRAKSVSRSQNFALSVPLGERALMDQQLV